MIRLIKYLQLIFLLTLLLTKGAAAQQSDFNRATDLLEEQEFRTAIEQFQTLEDQGHESGALWFNLGFAYSQIDSLGMAKYYFLKSAEYPETDMDAEKALETINQRFSRRSAVLPPLPWERFFNFLDDEIGTFNLYIAGFLFLYLAVVSVLILWFYKRRQSLFRIAAYTGLLISLLLFLSAFYINYLDNRYDTAVVVERQSRVHQAPDFNSAEVSTAYEGYTLTVDNHESSNTEGWFYIRLENGMNGWIADSSVQVVS